MYIRIALPMLHIVNIVNCITISTGFAVPSCKIVNFKPISTAPVSNPHHYKHIPYGRLSIYTKESSFPFSKKKSVKLRMSNRDPIPPSEKGASLPFKGDPVVREASLSLRRTSWASWWAQVILTSVSGVTLLFSKSVLNGGSVQGRVIPPGGFFFAGSGLSLSVLSIFWTWGGARLSRRLLRNTNPKTKEPYTRIKVATMIRRAVTIGSYLNIAGMFITLLGAEQIVGLLAARALTTQGISPFGAAGVAGAGTIQTLQPLDILIVQANTNTLLSHFVSLVCSLYLTRSVRRLDPPSVEEEDIRDR